MLLLGLAQAPPCPTEAATALRDAVTLAQRLDLPAAAARLDPVSGRCARARIAALYLRALQTARDAYRTGGDAASLQPVTAVIDALAQEYDGDRHAELARVVLMAAVAAAQSERADMELLLVHAVALERRLIADGEAPAPGVTAAEAAGDLWLQVHRFEAAAAAYTLAATLSGSTPRITLGLARTASQMKQREPACRAYRSFVSDWRGPASAAEAVEARAFAELQCQDLTRE